MKKNPFKKYNKKSGEVPFIGTMASNSLLREKNYLNYGCNNFKGKKSAPISFWTDADIFLYKKKYLYFVVAYYFLFTRYFQIFS